MSYLYSDLCFNWTFFLYKDVLNCFSQLLLLEGLNTGKAKGRVALCLRTVQSKPFTTTTNPPLLVEPSAGGQTASLSFMSHPVKNTVRIH